MAQQDLTQFWRDNPALKGRKKEFGILGLSLVVAANSVNVLDNVQVPPQYDFVVCLLRGAAVVVATGVYVINQPAQVMTQNEGKSRNLSNIPVDFSAAWRSVSNAGPWGNTRGDEPFQLPYPITLRANEQLSVSVSAGAIPSPMRLDFAVLGIRVYHGELTP